MRSGAALVLGLGLVLGVALVAPAPALAASTVGVGTWENTSSALHLVGSWTKKKSRRDSGGSSSVLTKAGSAELTFKATGVRWTARTNAYSGIAEVYLDQTLVATVDLYTKSTAVKQTVWEIGQLTDATHTLRIVRTGTKNARSSGTGIQVDTLQTFVAPDVTAPAAPTGLRAALNDDDVALTWGANTEPDVAAYRLYRREGSDATRTLVTTTTAGTTSAVDAGRLPGRTYGYDVVAVDKAGNASSSSSAVSVTLPVSAQGQGTYEESNPALRLKGAWTSTTSGADSGGASALLNAAGYAQLSFTTSGVRWIARRDSASGTADVYLDGVKVKTVDLYAAASTPRQVAYEVTGLAETTHTLRVVWTGAKNRSSAGTRISLDAFVAPDTHAPAAPTGLTATAPGSEVRLTWTANGETDLQGYRVYRREDGAGTRTLVGTTAPGTTRLTDAGRTPGTVYAYDVVAYDTSGNVSGYSSVASVVPGSVAQDAGTYENGSTAITAKGSWATVSDAADSGGTHTTLKSAGYAQVGFRGSAVRWVSRLDRTYGIATVTLDGVAQPKVDLYAASPTTRRVVFEATGLSAGTHNLKIAWTGTKNTAATGTTIALDSFVVPDTTPPAPPTGVAARSSGHDVAVTWAAGSETDLATYRVYRRAGGTQGGSDDRVLVGTTRAGETAFTDTGRTPGDTYRYDVVALDLAGNASEHSEPATVTIAVVAAGAGTYENDDASVTLDGDWSPITSRMDSGGSYASLNSAGFAQVSFSTSGIRWIARTNSYSGIADVYLDGVKQPSVDLYSASTKFQQVVYEATGLPETTHTLRVVRTGTKNDSSRSYTISLDAFVAPDVYPPSAPSGLMVTPMVASAGLGWQASPEPDVAGYRVFRGGETGDLKQVAATEGGDTDDVDAQLTPGATYRYQVSAVDASGNESLRSPVVGVTIPVAPLPAGTYEDDSADFVRKGSWTRSASGSANTDSGGAFSTLSADGYAEITFGTSGLRWLARTNSYSGTADVYLDGVKKATVDLYSSTTRYAQLVYEVHGLSETGHTLRIVRTGNKNASSTGRVITLDAFVAPDVYAPSSPTAVVASPVRTGATIGWRRNPERDVASYEVYRRADGSSTDVLVGTTDEKTTSFTDVGLANASAFSWTVVARDTSGNRSVASPVADLTTGADPYAAYAYRYATCPAATVTVANRSQLLSAISAAGPGTVIVLKPGSYGSDYVITTKATVERPFWICGPRSAVFDGGSVTKGYGLRVNAANNLVLAGMTVRNVQKGVSVQYAKRVTIADLRVEQIGDEAIHLKNMTSDSTVIGNSIESTGRNAKNYGEGVYVGTAQGNWCAYNNCQPDTSDRNVVAFNDIRDTTAENIEAKAATNDGVMWKNTLDGAGIVADDADSLIQVMGSGWIIGGNTGADVPDDAIQVWNTDDGSYGLDNVVYDNAISNDLKGYVVRFPYVDAGNVVGCDNRSVGKALGLSNKTCQN